MTIELKMHPGARYIELGGGACPLVRPNVDARMCYDTKGNPTVDFTADFNEPLPVTSDEWDGVFSHYALEHISWRKVPQFLKEVLRILKPGGKAVFVTANTAAQLKWVQDHPEGWDGKNYFESASCKLFGDNDYPENTHRCFFSPEIITDLLRTAGFASVEVRPYGARGTDMVVEAKKAQVPQAVIVSSNAVMKPGTLVTLQETEGQLMARGAYPKEDAIKLEPKTVPTAIKIAPEFAGRHPRDATPRTAFSPDPSSAFNKQYFDHHPTGGYRDTPANEITARHVLARKPESVLELGTGRGYVLKRLQDAGISKAYGLEVSKHCYLTRACEGIRLFDLTKTRDLRKNVKEVGEDKELWPFATHVRCPADPSVEYDEFFDLGFSLALLEHLPEDVIPAVIREMVRTCKRGLHGVTFTSNGQDPMQVTLKPREWWQQQFAVHAPGWPVEILDREELERGEFPQEVLQGNGKLKLNIGSFTTQHHHGWTNLDIHDLQGFAQQHGYKFQRCDVRNGLPYDTGKVDLIVHNHFLEHLTYEEGLRFLRECRRVLNPHTGAMRVIVPDAGLLNTCYAADTNIGGGWGGSTFKGSLSDFDEVNDGCAAAPTAAGKLWALLHSGHQAAYDYETLADMLKKAGFTPYPSQFRDNRLPSLSFWDIRRETIDQLPCLSLYCNAVPAVG